ncbi:MAG: dephospho-CoA kinase [Saprospiraceae bacterium]
MLKVGITGGIGSGKTTICKIFETLDIPIYYADNRAKWLMVNDVELVKGIKELFGKQAYLENGLLNREYIGSIVFSDKVMLEKLNQLVHPAVRLDGENWFQSHVDKPYALKEAALHFESGGYKLMDKMITVFAPKAMRINRVMQRDSTTAEAVKARIDKQLPDSEKVRLADFVIYNDGTESLIKQVVDVHQALVEISR